MSASLRRIVLFGPESTGKSTLAERLAARFAAPWSPEYVREYWDSHDGVIGPGDLEAIARGQVMGEDAAAALAKAQRANLVFHDTDLLTCTLWDDLLFPGACPPWTRDEAVRRAKAASLYLFCDTDLTWAPDPQRCFPDAEGRAMCRELWMRTLTDHHLPWVPVSGDWPEREARAVAAVEALLQT